MATEREDFMLTTYDNPYNPFDDFVRWLKEDLRLRHDCCGYLARESVTVDVADEAANETAIVEAANRIVSREPAIYKIVHQKDFVTNQK